jgi:hypothetical protein
VYGELAQPVEEVFPEFFQAHQISKVGVGRGDEPEVNRHGTRRADRVDALLLDRAQEL